MINLALSEVHFYALVSLLQKVWNDQGDIACTDPDTGAEVAVSDLYDSVHGQGPCGKTCAHLN